MAQNTGSTRESTETNKDFVITDEWMKSYSTNRKGWKRGHLAILGVPWPLAKGWLSALVGRRISQDTRRAFEAAATKIPDELSLEQAAEIWNQTETLG